MTLLSELCQCRAFSSAAADGRFAYSGATPHYAPDRPFNARHVRLELALDFNQKSLTGLCTTTLEAIADLASDIVFDAVDFQIQKISAKGKTLRYDYDKRRLTIHLPAPLKRGARVEIAIRYKTVKPKLGLHFVGPDRSYPDKPTQAWTQGEDEYNHFWFPCHDAPQERATTEMIVTVPAAFTAVSNGALVRTSKSGSKRVFHWKQDVPHSMYLVSLAVGEFTEIKEKWRHVPVLYYVTPGREEDAMRAFGKTPAMLEFFSTKTGVPYAYAKYSQVAAVDFIYGGMENTSATTQTAMTLHDARAHLDFSSDPLVAHELAHQWFGDLVTCKDWSHAWLNESFATYFEALFKEHDLGYDEFIFELRGNAEAYLDEDKDRYRRPLVTRIYKNTNDLFDRHLYEKGSCILHMIRNLLGDAAWWRSINLYLTRHKTRSVETVDLIQAIQDATGKNLRPFFDQWIYKGGHPEYKVRFWWDAKAKQVSVRVLQTHGTNEETGLFSMPITFAFLKEGKWKRFTETVSKKDHLFTFALSGAPDLMLFDPDHVILKRVDLVKPETMYRIQLTEDPHVLGRIDAARALGGISSPTSVHALRAALQNEKFWAVRMEVAAALGRHSSLTAMEALLDGLKQIEHPKVRRALYEALGSYPSHRVQDVIRQSFETEKSWLVEAEAIRALGRQKDPTLITLLKEQVKRESWNDVIRNAALDAIGLLQVAEAVPLLKEYSRYGNSPNARMTAIRRLGALGRGREDVQDHLIKLLEDTYLLVRLAVVRALGGIADERAVEPLMKLTSGDLDGRLKRTAEEAVRKIRKGMETEFPTK
jgi:aminopeptidase N